MSYINFFVSLRLFPVTARYIIYDLIGIVYLNISNKRINIIFNKIMLNENKKGF